MLATYKAGQITCEIFRRIGTSGLTSALKTPAPSVAVGRIEFTVTPLAPISFASTSRRNCGAILLPS